MNDFFPHRVYRHGEEFWSSLTGVHRFLIQDMISRNQEMEGLFLIELSPGAISLHNSDDIDVQNLKPTQALIFGDRSWVEICNKTAKWKMTMGTPEIGAAVSFRIEV